MKGKKEPEVGGEFSVVRSVDADSEHGGGRQ